MTDRPQHPPVLLYHSIAELAPTPDAGARAFRSQIALLKRSGYHTLTPAEFLTGLDDGEWPRRSIFLTFDDGYLDFHDVAWPILQEFGMTATVFLVHDALEGGIEAWRGPTYPVMPPVCGWDKVLAMRGQGVYYGSHTLSHVELNHAEPAEVVEQVTRSKSLLEQRLGDEVALFSYPYGAASSEARAAVEAAGYEAAFGVSPAAPTRFELFRRIVKPAKTLTSFRLRVSRAYEPLRCALHVTRGERC
ncbi:MAG: polysaccharide deacetylase family protein [Coriobacteriia bacterium]|nr:polysaccharide deacetylase family protein [Coriobacteriia bacterium]